MRVEAVVVGEGRVVVVVVTAVGRGAVDVVVAWAFVVAVVPVVAPVVDVADEADVVVSPAATTEDPLPPPQAVAKSATSSTVAHCLPPEPAALTDPER